MLRFVGKSVYKGLESAGIFYKRPEQGIMIETPAAVMVSDELSVVPSMILQIRKAVREMNAGIV